MKSNNPIEQLEKQFNENINSHVFLVETNDQEQSLIEIKSLIKKLIAQDDITKSQIDEETYLELIVIRPEGKEIKKDAILELQNRIKTKPILSNYIFYIIMSAESLNLISANKLLKTIEEPNDNVIGFFITSNIDLILPTVKSRCETISEMFEEVETENPNEEIHEYVKELIKSIETQNHIEFSKIKENTQIMKDNFKIVEKILKSYYNTACNLSNDELLDNGLLEFIRNNNRNGIIIKKAKYLNGIFNKLISNMNNDLLLEKIFLELKEVK